MKPLRVLLILVFSLSLMGNTSCDEAAKNIGTDSLQDPGKYIEVTKDVIENVKETDLSGDGLEKTINIINTGRDIAGAAAVIPGAQGYAAAITAGLGVIGTILGIFTTVREKKKVKVVTEESKKHEAKANDYRDGITAAIAHGDNQDVADVIVLKEVLNTETKTHFNEIGKDKL